MPDITVKTGQEAEELLRVLSLYGALKRDQIRRLFPGKEDAMDALVTRLRKSLRVQVDQDRVVSLAPGKAEDHDVATAVWVLIDFIDRVTFHSASDYPATLTFFTDKDEVYEVAVIHKGQETLMVHAFWCRNDPAPPRRIIVLDEPGQVQYINIPNVAGFCTVDSNGEVSYFK